MAPTQLDSPVVAHRAPAMVAADTSTWSVSLNFSATTFIALTPTWNQEISGTGNWVYIYDMAAPGGPKRVSYCTSGTTCTVSTIPGETQASYQAFIGAASNSFPSPVLASSGTVTPPPWTISLAPTFGSKIDLTATTNYDLSYGVADVEIFDSSDLSTSGVHYLALCWKGTTCTVTGTVPYRSNTSYVAFVGASASNTYPMQNPYATSNFATPPPWTLSLGVVGGNLVATTNYDETNTTIWTEIFDMTKQQTYITYLGWCNAGTLCTMPLGTAGHMFLASVAPTLSNYFPQSTNPPPLATSTQVGTVGPVSAFETTGGSNPSEQNMCFACTNDPINTSNGEFFESYTDLNVKGRGPGLSLGRTYSSQRASYDSPFGYGWSFSYDMRLIFPASGAADVTQENGSVDHFIQNSSGAWVAPSQVNARLVQNADGTWTFTRRGREISDFDFAGKLLRIRDLNGYSTTVTRDAQGRIGSITDSAGRSITFAYDANSHITSVTDPVSRTVRYGYDGVGRLTSVTDPVGAVTNYGYGSFNLLTTITDANGKAITNTYDTAYRVASQTDKDGNTTTFAYSGNGTNNTTTTTSPGGRVTVETYNAGQRISVTKGSGNAAGGDLVVPIRPDHLRPDHDH